MTGRIEEPTPEQPELATVEGRVLDAPTLPEVAKKRAVQAFLQGLAIDVAVAVALALIAGVGGLETVEALQLFGISLGKTIVIAAAQYVVRRFVDTAGYRKDTGTAEATVSGTVVS